MLLTPLTNKWSINICLHSFIYLLVINMNENINQHSYSFGQYSFINCNHRLTMHIRIWQRSTKSQTWLNDWTELNWTGMEEEMPKLHFCEKGHYGYKCFVGNKRIILLCLLGCEMKEEKRSERMRNKQDGKRLCNLHALWDPRNITAKSSLSVWGIVGCKL